MAKCNICFDDGITNPIFTPCIHGFCQECILKWIVEKQHMLVIPCPVCKYDISELAGYRDRGSLYTEEPINEAMFNDEDDAIEQPVLRRSTNERTGVPTHLAPTVTINGQSMSVETVLRNNRDFSQLFDFNNLTSDNAGSLNTLRTGRNTAMTDWAAVYPSGNRIIRQILQPQNDGLLSSSSAAVSSEASTSSASLSSASASSAAVSSASASPADEPIPPELARRLATEIRTRRRSTRDDDLPNYDGVSSEEVAKIREIHAARESALDNEWRHYEEERIKRDFYRNQRSTQDYFSHPIIPLRPPLPRRIGTSLPQETQDEINNLRRDLENTTNELRNNLNDVQNRNLVSSAISATPPEALQHLRMLMIDPRTRTAGISIVSATPMNSEPPSIQQLISLLTPTVQPRNPNNVQPNNILDKVLDIAKSRK